MSTEEIMKEYQDKICPNCEHRTDKNYRECNIVMTIDNKANCINYKCLEFCKDRKENQNKFKKVNESKLYVTAKKQNSLMKLV